MLRVRYQSGVLNNLARESENSQKPVCYNNIQHFRKRYRGSIFMEFIREHSSILKLLQSLHYNPALSLDASMLDVNVVVENDIFDEISVRKRVLRVDE